MTFMKLHTTKNVPVAIHLQRISFLNFENQTVAMGNYDIELTDISWDKLVKYLGIES